MTTKDEKLEMTVATVVLPGGQKVTFWRGPGRQESVTTRVFLGPGCHESTTTRVLSDAEVETAAQPPSKVSPAE